MRRVNPVTFGIILGSKPHEVKLVRCPLCGQPMQLKKTFLECNSFHDRNTQEDVCPVLLNAVENMPDNKIEQMDGTAIAASKYGEFTAVANLKKRRVIVDISYIFSTVHLPVNWNILVTGEYFIRKARKGA